MQRDAQLFDTSNYLKDHFLHSKYGRLMCRNIDRAVWGLRPKVYSLLYGDKDKRTTKGIARACQRQMKHKHYKRCLFEGTQTVLRGRHIHSECHELYTEKKRKIALSPCDDKRHVLDDAHSTLDHGHVRIKGIVTLNLSLV